MNIKDDAELPAYKRGYEICKNNGFCIIAMSIGNSYFNEKKIGELLPFANNHFSDLRILIADIPSIHTYQAIGYDEKTAKKKTRLAGNRLRNYCNRVIAKMSGNNLKHSIRFIDWNKEVSKNKEYQKQLKIIKELYDKHLDFKDHVHHEVKIRHEICLQCFREDSRNTTREVLQNKIKESINIESAIEEGVKYLLEELAFLLASPNIFSVNNVVYLYHMNWPIYINLIDGMYDGTIRNQLGFIETKD